MRRYGTQHACRVWYILDGRVVSMVGLLVLAFATCPGSVASGLLGLLALAMNLTLLLFEPPRLLVELAPQLVDLGAVIARWAGLARRRRFRLSVLPALGAGGTSREQPGEERPDRETSDDCG